MNSTIEILAFGQIIDITGQKVLQMEHVHDTEELKASLNKTYPSIRATEYRIAVNMEIIRGNVNLNPGDVVALLPPFSGG
jgi:molybdopterin converting factor small subunit